MNVCVVCISQSQLGGVITTGGGFSTYYPQPSWQTNAVNAYFAGLPSSDTPAAGYNRLGRGIPDISLLGAEYLVVIDSQLYFMFGTSCSAPVLAAYGKHRGGGRCGHACEDGHD